MCDKQSAWREVIAPEFTAFLPIFAGTLQVLRVSHSSLRVLSARKSRTMMMIGSTTSEYQQENRKMFLERSRDTTNGADSVLVGLDKTHPLRILSAPLLI